LIVDIKETEHEVNADKTKYMTMSRNQSEWRSNNIKNDNKRHETVEEFKY
jgi:hypothetical protein